MEVLPDAEIRAAVLVEGVSDVLALRAVAAMRGVDLGGRGVALVPMGGATNVRRNVERYGPAGLGVPLAGLYDAAEEPFFRRALGAGNLEAAGFFGCMPDLEHELLRALGVGAVVRVIAAEGSSPPWSACSASPRSATAPRSSSCTASSDPRRPEGAVRVRADPRAGARPGPHPLRGLVEHVLATVGR